MSHDDIRHDKIRTNKHLNHRQWWALLQKYKKTPVCNCFNSDTVSFEGGEDDWRALMEWLGTLAFVEKPNGGLKPCHRCASTDIKMKDMLSYTGPNFCMTCDSCGFSTYWADTLERAQDIWNAETPETEKKTKEEWTEWNPNCGLERPDLPEGTEVIFMNRDGFISIPYAFDQTRWTWGKDSENDKIAYKIVEKEKADD